MDLLSNALDVYASENQNMSRGEPVKSFHFAFNYKRI